MGALPLYTVGVYRSPVPARRAPRKHLTDTTQDACSVYGGSSAMHGRTWLTCTELQPQHRSNNIVCAFIFGVTVAALSPTNLLCSPTVYSTEIHNTCPSAHATDITAPGASDGTCTGHNSQTPLIDEKKSKNCAQKHMAVPGHAVRWDHRAIGVASLKFLLAPRQKLLRCSHNTCKLSIIDIIE